MADALIAALPSLAPSDVRPLPRTGGFDLWLEGPDGGVEAGLRGSTLRLRTTALLRAPGDDVDSDEVDARTLAMARAALAWGRPRGATRLVAFPHHGRVNEARAWVRAGALPVVGGSTSMRELVGLNLDALERRWNPGEAAIALARRLAAMSSGEPHALRALAAMPHVVRGPRGPTLGHAALRHGTWPVEVDLAEPSSAAMFAAACGDAPAGAARDMLRRTGREAMLREGFSPEEATEACGRPLPA